MKVSMGLWAGQVAMTSPEDAGNGWWTHEGRTWQVEKDPFAYGVQHLFDLAELVDLHRELLLSLYAETEGAGLRHRGARVDLCFAIIPGNRPPSYDELEPCFLAWLVRRGPTLSAQDADFLDLLALLRKKTSTLEFILSVPLDPEERYHLGHHRVLPEQYLVWKFRSFDICPCTPVTPLTFLQVFSCTDC